MWQYKPTLKNHVEDVHKKKCDLYESILATKTKSEDVTNLVKFECEQYNSNFEHH